jgi:hypothetical protein
MATTKRRNVFDWFDRIRARPALYLGDRGLGELEVLLCGYYAALYTHGIVEEAPDMRWHFLGWLHRRTAWSCSQGWAQAIGSRHPARDEALAAFFRLVDEYRRLRPVRLCTVQLGPDHNPTGKRVVIGLDGRMEKPCRVDVFRYLPEPLHFLRFSFADRIENDTQLMTGLDEAKRWVLDELQVDFGLWKQVDEKTMIVEG